MRKFLITLCFILYGFNCHGKRTTFEDILRKHGLEENSITILKRNGIVDTKVLLALDNDDIAKLGLNLGQKAVLRQLIQKLRASAGEDSTPKFKPDQNISPEEKLEKMTEENFWCIFKCLGGIGAVGIGGVLALVALVTYGLPVIGFGAAGIVAGTLAAKIMALYGGSVAAGSLVATLQSVAAAGLGWNTILTTLFGSSAVMAAVQKGCAHCFK